MMLCILERKMGFACVSGDPKTGGNACKNKIARVWQIVGFFLANLLSPMQCSMSVATAVQVSVVRG